MNWEAGWVNWEAGEVNWEAEGCDLGSRRG